MKRFAKIDASNVVSEVIAAESAEWCVETFGGTWVETFKDRSSRVNYAAVGYSYDSDLDAFIPPKVFDSWVLNTETCSWDAPIKCPDDGNQYLWNEETQSWNLLDLS